jgi:hypothetical protein
LELLFDHFLGSSDDCWRDIETSGLVRSSSPTSPITVLTTSLAYVPDQWFLPVPFGDDVELSMRLG